MKLSQVLERVPEGRNDRKPHEESTLLGCVAALVAKMPAWIQISAQGSQIEPRIAARLWRSRGNLPARFAKTSDDED